MADKKYTNRELLDYNFNESDYEDVSLAKQTASDALTKYNSVGDWKYGKEDAWSKAQDALTNRKAFSYDLNADALYQQYKDQYITSGKQAMQDAMGQAAALTGGYASSYAATVGNQAYQSHLQGLNDKVPELYQLAMQRYNMEGDQLKTAFDVLNSDRESDYGRFIDNKTMLQNDVQLYNNLYDAAYTRQQTDYNNAFTSNNENYWNDYNANYKAEQDSSANQLAQDQLQLQKDQFDWQKSQAKVSSSPVTAKDIESSLPSGIIDKVGSLGNDIERANYLADQVAKGYITADQKNYILTQTVANDTIEYDGKHYFVVDDGGWNGFLGLGGLLGNIDNNAKVMTEDGQVYSMEDLAKGKAGDAEYWTKDKVVGLQRKLGIH